MWKLLCALAAAAAPFWESAPPSAWTEAQLAGLFEDSPWARQALVSRQGLEPPVVVYLASAKPMQDAEDEWMRRRVKNPDRFLFDEYRDHLREKPEAYLVLAVAAVPAALSDPKESARMEEECRLRVGRRTYRLAGHFPPTQADPHLRLLFPREVRPGDKRLSFELYLPGVAGPYRTAEFETKTLVYRNRPEM